MTIYEKIASAKEKLANSGLSKSGQNAFSKAKYFELGDFLPALVKLQNELKFCTVFDFAEGMAKLEIINSEKPDERITYTSPFGSAKLANCHEVQNIGAVQTYQRRYLYMAAFDIVEHDIIDSTDYSKPQQGKPQQAKPAPQKQAESPTKLSKAQQKELINLSVQHFGAENANERFAEETGYKHPAHVPPEKVDEVRQIIENSLPF